ncbi:MAG: dihydrodipicolinate synthase family protein [Promethearchaeota archaeon]
MARNSPTRGGIVTPLVTLFDHDPHHLHEAGMEVLVDHVLENGTDAIFLLSSTGEGLWFEGKPDFKRYYLESLTSAVSGRVPLLVGLYGNSLGEYEENYEFLERACNLDGVVVAPPYRVHLPDGELLPLLTRVLSGLGVPAYLYNNPASFGGNVVKPEWVADWEGVDQLVGIKDSSPEYANKVAFVEECARKAGLQFFSGKEGDYGKILGDTPEEYRDLLGVVPSIGNISNLPARIKRAGLGGDAGELERLSRELNEHRHDFYDGAVPLGKAQRGLKVALQALYGEEAVGEQPVVTPKFERDMPSGFRESVAEATARWVELGHIERIGGG